MRKHNIIGLFAHVLFTDATDTIPPEVNAVKYEHSSTTHEAISPPYVSFTTFRTLLEWLQLEGVPLHFDRSFWRSKFSGSTGTQLVAALRFLGLLNGDSPTSNLQIMVEATPEDRRFILREALKGSYPNIAFEDLDRATPAMVRRWFKTYPIDGHTLRKAVSFFVHASVEAEISMSNAVRKMARTRVTKPSNAHQVRQRARQGAPEPTDTYAHGAESDPTASKPNLQRTEPMKGNLTSVELESGGTVTVELSLDLFRLSSKDREFVMKLVDLTQGYGT